MGPRRRKGEENECWYWFRFWFKKLRPGAGTVNGIINVCRIKGTGISLRDKGD